MIEISLKFEKIHDEADDRATSNNSTEKQQHQQHLKFLELSYKTLSDVCASDQVHSCVSDLLMNALTSKSIPMPTSTSPENDMTPFAMETTNVTVHQTPSDSEAKKDPKPMKRNSSLRTSMKSAHSMETILEKNLNRLKDISPDESKAKSVGQLNGEDDDDEFEYIENGESIELIFISDEYVNKVQKQEQEMIILDENDSGKRRDSLTNNNNKKIVIITDEYKHKVLRNNSIVVTNEKKMLKKKQQLKKSKTYDTNSNSYLQYDEPYDKMMESKKIDATD